MVKTNERGVTIVALVTTIIILLILSTIGVTSGKSTIEFSNFNKLKNQLTVLQIKVNELNQQNKTDIGQEIGDNQKLILNNEIVSNIIYKDKTEKEKNTIEAGFRLLNGNQIKDQLGLDGYKGNYLINVKYRYVVLCEGLEYNGITYYMIDQMEDGLYNVEYHNKNSDSGSFEVNIIAEGDKCKVEITDINYDGYVSDWQVKYKLSTNSQWNTSDDLNFYVRQQGVYDIKVVHGDEIELETKTLTIVFSNVLTDTVNSDYVKVGDYVQYTPDEVTNTDKIYTNLLSNLKTYSGNTDSTKNTTSTLTQEKLNWRVLDITDDGQVRLISDKPTTSKITLRSYDGYNNAVKLLDDTCSTLYNSKLTSKVQNIKIEDIQDKMKEKDLTKIWTDYGATYTPTNIKYPKILEKEENQTVEKTNNILTKLSVSVQDSFVNGNDTSATSTLKVTAWSDFIKPMTEKEYEDGCYKLFINNGEKNYDTYWMSSRCVSTSSDSANFIIYYVNNGAIGVSYLYCSNEMLDSCDRAIRPIITLNSNVQLDTNDTTKDGTSVNKAWIIKN